MVSAKNEEKDAAEAELYAWKGVKEEAEEARPKFANYGSKALPKVRFVVLFHVSTTPFVRQNYRNVFIARQNKVIVPRRTADSNEAPSPTLVTSL